MEIIKNIKIQKVVLLKLRRSFLADKFAAIKIKNDHFEKKIISKKITETLMNFIKLKKNGKFWKR